MKSLLVLMATMLAANNVTAMSQDITMQVGETKTLYLPSSFTNMYPYCKSTTWMSYGNEFVTITSSSLFSVTVKAKKAISTPIVVRCNYYYYLLMGGSYVYGGSTYYDFMVTVNGTQPTDISLYPSEVTLDRGKSVNLKPMLIPENATTTYSWSTSSEGVATVDQTGHVIGQNYGEATITCKTANGLTAKCSVKVQRPGPTSVDIDDLIVLAIGESQTLTPTLKPSNASTTFSWSSDNTQVATVNNSGMVTARKNGSARITVTTANGLSDHCDVSVYAPYPSSVSIKKSTTLEVGESETLTPTLTPSYAEATYTWTSSNSNVATISPNGTVKAIAPGTANITVKTNNGKSDSCKVTVNELIVQPSSISIKDNLNLSVGDEYTLSPTVIPANATTSYTWTSSNSNVATVSSSGTVKAISPGTCTITVRTDNGKSDSCKAMVNCQMLHPTSIGIMEYLDLSVGDEYTLYPTVIPSNATTTICWSSSNKDVATVEDGMVTAVGVGSCEIYATTSNNLTAKCLLVVTDGYSGGIPQDGSSKREGTYRFTAEVTRYADSEITFDESFEMTIDCKDGTYYITSMMGCNTVVWNHEGLEMRMKDDNHSEIFLDYNNDLGKSISGGYFDNLHLLKTEAEYHYVRDEAIPITFNTDGSVSIGNFYVFAFGRDTDYEYLKEAKYCMVKGSKLNTDCITTTVTENDRLAVYDLKGSLIYSGPKSGIPSLPKGVYLFKNENKTTKKLLR